MNRHRAIVGIALACVVIAIGIVVFRKAIADVVAPLIFAENTKYAPGYDETKFRSISKGVSKANVRTRLGDPLAARTFADGETVWYYSEQAAATDNYFVRNVVFDRDGHVVRTFAEFYLD
jgi:outer membrane protein assembly factor BamE (lipoprotein component of BamABCDE complex)